MFIICFINFDEVRDEESITNSSTFVVKTLDECCEMKYMK